MCRKATNLSVVRDIAANEPNVSKQFVEYTKVLHDLNIISLVQIWFCGETGVQNVLKGEKVLCETCKTSYQTVAADHGETSMVLTFVNGIGDAILAMLLHKEQWVQVTWTLDAPVGVCLAATSKEYITKQKFHEFDEWFVCWFKTHHLLDRPHLLIIDSHKSNVYNVAFFDCMKANNIHVMAILPNTSHIVQALNTICPV